MRIRPFLCLLFLLPFSVTCLVGQTHRRPATRKSEAKPTVEELKEQMQEMHDQLQGEIDLLKQQLATRDQQVQAAQAAEASQQAANATLAAQAAQTKQDLATVESSAQSAQANSAATAVAVAQAQAELKETRTAIQHPATLHYKGIDITPGGFLAAETVWRERAMNADIYTNWNATPFANAGEYYISEFVPTARNSRLSVLASGETKFGSIRGYVEGDFLSAGVTSNNLQSNSYTLRLRQGWGQANFGHTSFTGGQMWSLLTENSHGATVLREQLPLFFDANLHVGFTYTRQLGLRLEHAYTPGFTMAVALENSQYQFSASNAPSNFFFGAAGAAGGLNNSLANYTDQVAPDMLVKASFDPGFGHYEVGGIVRLFRDRYYLSGTAGGPANNNTAVGGGFVANARFPLAKKVSFGVHAVGGDGTGRYGASLLPDITVHPDGRLEPLRNLQMMTSLEAHPGSKWDLFAYGGGEYVQRSFYPSSTGTLVGYAPPTLSNTGCNTEQPPSGNTGALPGTAGCAAVTRDILQGSAGAIYRFYTGPIGRLQYGVAYSYIVRNGWSGVGGAPRGDNNFFYTSFRYYLP